MHIHLLRKPHTHFEIKTWQKATKCSAVQQTQHFQQHNTLEASICSVHANLGRTLSWLSLCSETAGLSAAQFMSFSKDMGFFFFSRLTNIIKSMAPRGEQEENSISFCLFALPNTEQCAHSKLRVKLGGLGPQPHVE